MPTRTGKKGASLVSADMRLVVLHGKEAFLIEAHTRTLRQALEDQFGEVGVFRYDGTTAELADVLDEIRSYGLIQPHKLVIVDEADKFLSRDEGVNREPMERYAKNPVDHATLLFRATRWYGSKLDKHIKEAGAIIKCDQLKDAGAVTWCIDRARDEHGFAIQRPAANLLVQRVGTNLHRLDAELTKLAARAESNEAVTPADVTEVVGRSREEQAWEIQSAILSGDPGTALAKIRDLREISQAPRELVMWSMIDLARKLHAASRLLRQGMPAGAIRKEYRLWDDAGSVALEVARRKDPHALAQLLQESIDSDRRAKSGIGDGETGLECLAVTLTNQLATASRRVRLK